MNNGQSTVVCPLCDTVYYLAFAMIVKMNKC